MKPVIVPVPVAGNVIAVLLHPAPSALLVVLTPFGHPEAGAESETYSGVLLQPPGGSVTELSVKVAVVGELMLDE